MELNFYTLGVLYLVYSFLGWVAETVVAAARGKGFVNRGVASGPFCFIYGFTAVFLAVGFADLRGSPLYLFLGCAVFATLVEWLTAKALERMQRRKWWDYSGKRFNLDGYICLQYSVLWGLLGAASVLWGNGLLIRLYGLLPGWLGKALVWVGLAYALLDQLASAVLVSRVAAEHPRLGQFNQEVSRRSDRLRRRIVLRVERRIQRAYPRAEAPQPETAAAGESIGPGDLVWLFTIGAFLGDVVETLFCRVTAGVWMSRSSLVWGAFSVVWGLALALATVLLRRSEDKSDSSIFLFGFVMGGAYEYVCSAVGELLFGVIFWDYSGYAFNLGGRINLLYCFFWGIAAVVWLRYGYPLVSRMMRRLRRYIRPWMTVLLTVFMLVNMLVSALALARYNARLDGVPPANAVEVLLDERFGNERMERIYPNAQQT